MTDYLYFDSSGKQLDVQQHLDPVAAYAAGRTLAEQYRTDIEVTVAAFTFRVGSEAMAQPNQWYRDQVWREVDSSDAADRAHAVRLALADLLLYPSIPMELDAGFAMMEANKRAALHDIIEELARTDLVALFNAVRLLALFPRNDRVFDRIRARDRMMRERLPAEESGS